MNYQFTSRQLTLDNLSRSNQGRMTFKRLHLLHGASSYQILHGNTYSKSYMVFQFTPLHLTLGGIDQIKIIGYSINLAVYHRQLDIIGVA